MNIFESIKNAIFRRKAEASPAPAQRSQTSTKTASGPATGQPGATTARASEPVDVEAILEGLAAKNRQKLNWRTSIVDLMKLLDLDSSLSNRTELARELGYTGNTADTATMNIWLQKQVMKKLAESGGKVPASLRD